MNQNNSKDLYEETKDGLLQLENTITEEENCIDDCYRKIGMLYASIHEKDGSYEKDFEALMEAIKSSKEKIESYKAKQLELNKVMVCPECGAEIPSYSAFCNLCGARVTSNESKEQNENAVIEQEVVIAEPLTADVNNVDSADSEVKADVEVEQEAVIVEPLPAEEKSVDTVEDDVKSAELEEPTDASVHFCIECGEALENGMIFCTNCGKSVNEEGLSDENMDEEEHVNADSLQEPIAETKVESENDFTVPTYEEIAVTNLAAPDVFDEVEAVKDNGVTHSDDAERHCKKCGKILMADSMFCIDCGTPVLQIGEETSTDAGTASEAEQKQIEVKCSGCGTILESGCAFCINCGRPVKSDNVQKNSNFVQSANNASAYTDLKMSANCHQDVNRCPDCGTVIEPGTAFCIECGKALGGNEMNSNANFDTGLQNNDNGEVIPNPAAFVNASEQNARSFDTASALSEKKTAFAPAFLKCAGCGASLPKGNAFCTSCGHPVANSDTGTTSEGYEQTAALDAGDVPAWASPAQQPSMQQNGNARKCTNCGTPILPDARACTFCGKPMYIDLEMPVMNKCPRCGTKIKGNVTYCTSCGARLC